MKRIYWIPTKSFCPKIILSFSQPYHHSVPKSFCPFRSPTIILSQNHSVLFAVLPSFCPKIILSFSQSYHHSVPKSFCPFRSLTIILSQNHSVLSTDPTIILSKNHSVLFA